MAATTPPMASSTMSLGSNLPMSGPEHWEGCASSRGDTSARFASTSPVITGEESLILGVLFFLDDVRFQKRVDLLFQHAALVVVVINGTRERDEGLVES